MAIIPHIFRIAEGKNNIAGLLPLAQLNPPMFRKFTGGIKTEYHAYIRLGTDGLGNPRRIGRPWVRVLPMDISQSEYSWLMANFGPEVTITCENKPGDYWQNCNANLFPLPEDKQPELGRWYSPPIDFKFLEVLEIEG